MLRWIGRKHIEWQEKRHRGEESFTLIELLVVVVIIGILAAIAIPTFLAQKNKAYEAQTKSSVRNAVTNAEAFAVNNNGSYANLTQADISNGISTANGVTLSLSNPTQNGYCVAGTNSNGGSDFHYTKASDTITTGGC